MAAVLVWLSASVEAQPLVGPETPPTKHVLLIFSEARDLPGNVMLEQSVRTELLGHGTNPVEFFAESVDAGRFPNPRHYRLFSDYLKNKYRGQNLDLVIVFMSRDFVLAQELPTSVVANLPLVFVVVNDLEVPEPPNGHPFTGVFQRFDIDGTLKFIFHLQPETRRVVVIGGVSVADRVALNRIQETSLSVDGVEFDFWTNRPVAEMIEASKSLPEGSVILLSTVQQDITGQPFYTSKVLQTLAPAASVPVYVLAAGLIGSGAVGGNVIDLESLGTGAGKLAQRVLAGVPVNQIPIQVRSNGIAMVDWRSLRRWNIPPSRLPANCLTRFRPHSLWADYKVFIVASFTILFVQAITIAGLLAQRRHRRRAEAEIQKQRTELAHVARVSTMGQLASALTHELNQPLGAILRNTEAAEVFLQSDQPDLKELRAILADIRKDDERAGNVIDRMRTLLKRRSLVSTPLDLCELVEDTVALARADAEARQIKFTLDLPAQLPAAHGDRVHLQQVLLNLILNGMDAMRLCPPARRILEVKLDATPNGNLRVMVKDCGAGISPDDAAHVFEPFFTTKPAGMGMGLAISRTIIEAHGGDIWVESNMLEGTTFTFMLPPMGLAKLKDGDLPQPP